MDGTARVDGRADDAPLRDSMIVIFTAMQMEAAGLKKKLTGRVASTRVPLRTWRGSLAGKDVLLAVTGVGKERAIEATDYIMSHQRPSMVISAGYCGGLNNKAKVGNLVVYRSLTDEDRSLKYECDGDLFRLAKSVAEKMPAPFCEGPGVSLTAACATPEEKNDLCQRSRADAVDMESFWIGQRVSGAGVPFITLRTVSDSAEEDLTPVLGMSRFKGPFVVKALRQVLRHPSDLATFRRLARNANVAGKNLAEFTVHFVGAVKA